MRPTIKRFATAFFIFIFGICGPANAAGQDDDPPIRYVVRKGDTLISLGDRYFRTSQSYRIVQRQNRIIDPHRIPVGKILIFPRNMLKYRPAVAELLSVRGQVTSGEGKLSTGQKLPEGTAIETGPSSFATMVLDDGSRISLPSNSAIRIRRLRTYILGNILDYDFDVARGGIRSTVVKQKSPDDRYRVRTPKAVSAVRGTDFQSRFDTDSQNDFAEVVEGGLAVNAGGGNERSLPAGNGLSVKADGGVVTETLLVAPELRAPGKLQSDKIVRFAALANLPIRYTIAADSGFIEQVADVIVPDGNAEFADLPDGNYFVRARAISANGLQGIPATFTFKRRMNSVTGSAGKEDTGYIFRWRAEGQGTQRFHFQLFRNAVDTVAMVDEAGLDTQMITLSDLPPADYFWRVASVQYIDSEVAISWTPFEKITVSAP
jgi:hypothetical protein